MTKTFGISNFGHWNLFVICDLLFIYQKIRIGALISGGGSNLQAIIDNCESGKIDGQMVFVGSDNSRAGGLQRAHKHGLPTFIVDYASIIRNYREASQRLSPPQDFDLKEAFAKQSFFTADSDPDKMKAFFITRAIAEANLLSEMKAYTYDLLVLAGFMRNLTPYFIDRVNTDRSRPPRCYRHLRGQMAMVTHGGMDVKSVDARFIL
jgi:phosphoribosylglycinamide formyltransferase-1